MFAKTEIAKKFRIWVLDILDKEVKTTANDRTPLRQARDRLAVGNMLVSDAYKVVTERYKVEHIDQIPMDKLPEAVAFVYEMILRLKPSETNIDEKETAQLVEAVLRQNTEMQDVWDGLKYINKKEFGRWSCLIVKTNVLAEKLSKTLSPRYATPKIDERNRCIIYGNQETKQIKLNWFNYPA